MSQTNLSIHDAADVKVTKVTQYKDSGEISYRGLRVSVVAEDGTKHEVFIFTQRPVNSGVITIMADEIIGTPAPVDYAGFVQVPPPPVDPDYCFDEDAPQVNPRDPADLNISRGLGMMFNDDPARETRKFK